MEEERWGIKITYSWGDDEPIKGPYATAEDAWVDMCKMAGKEAYVQNEEACRYRSCSVFYDAWSQKIDLHYHVDNEYCYYRIVEFDSED